MSTHCQAMSDWFELSIRHSVIYDEIIMTYHIHGWSPLCSTTHKISDWLSAAYFLFHRIITQQITKTRNTIKTIYYQSFIVLLVFLVFQPV